MASARSTALLLFSFCVPLGRSQAGGDHWDPLGLDSALAHHRAILQRAAVAQQAMLQGAAESHQAILQGAALAQQAMLQGAAESHHRAILQGAALAQRAVLQGALQPSWSGAPAPDEQKALFEAEADGEEGRGTARPAHGFAEFRGMSQGSSAVSRDVRLPEEPGHESVVDCGNGVSVRVRKTAGREGHDVFLLAAEQPTNMVMEAEVVLRSAGPENEVLLRHNGEVDQQQVHLGHIAANSGAAVKLGCACSSYQRAHKEKSW